MVTGLMIFIITDTGSFVGTIDGKGGTNTLKSTKTTGENSWLLDNTTAFKGTLNHTATLNGIATSNSTNFNNIQSLFGSEHADVTDTLTGRDQNNNWSITGTNAGSVANTASPADKVNFYNIENLIGNNKDDNFTLVDISHITGLIDGGDGSDSVKITGSASQYITLGTDISRIEALTAQAGTNHTLQASNSTNTWNISKINEGTINDGITGLTFTNFSNLVGGSGVDTFTITAAINSVKAGAGNDLIKVASTGLVNSAIDGEAGSDEVRLTTAKQSVNISTDIVRVETLTGFGTNNTLTINDGNNNWTVDTANAGKVGEVNFSHFDNLQGGTGVDTFTITAAINSVKAGAGNDLIKLASTGLVNSAIDGEDGTDEVRLTTAKQNVNISTDIVRVETLTGFGTNNTLTINDGNNNWIVDTANAGKVGDINFSHFDNLQGGSEVDTFTITAAINSVKAGAGNDLIKVASTGLVNSAIDGETGSDEVRLTTAKQNVNISSDIVRVETLTGFGTNNTLTINDGNNNWTVDTANAGNVGEVNFSHFDNLQGGTGVDSFTITAAINSVKAGAGNDLIKVASTGLVNSAIDGEDGTDEVRLTTAKQNVNVSSDIVRVETLTGFGTNNTLTINDGNNNWTVDTANAGKVGDINFSHFDNLQGAQG